MDAFQALYLQKKPDRTNKHHHPSTVIEVVWNVDESVYIVFDARNALSASQSALCGIFEHVVTSEINETAHFVFGQTINIDEISIQCDNASAANQYPIESDTFFNFKDIISGNDEFNARELERFEAITCPTEVDASLYYGNDTGMELGNHIKDDLHSKLNDDYAAYGANLHCKAEDMFYTQCDGTNNDINSTNSSSLTKTDEMDETACNCFDGIDRSMLRIPMVLSVVTLIEISMFLHFILL